MKKAIAILISTVVLGVSISIYGCKNDNTYNNVTTPGVVMQTGFNNEQYVWEEYIVSTNRVLKQGNVNERQ